MTGTLYKTSHDEVIEVTPKNGKDFKWEELHEFVDGYIEIVPLGDSDLVIVVNEEGKLNGLPINNKATEVWRIHWPTSSDFIVGNALICKRTMIK
jgi:hypothetical protein